VTAHERSCIVPRSQFHYSCWAYVYVPLPSEGPPRVMTCRTHAGPGEGKPGSNSSKRDCGHRITLPRTEMLDGGSHISSLGTFGPVAESATAYLMKPYH
jgi:hypothetical protein